MARVTGVFDVHVGGALLRTMQGATVSGIGGIQRQAVVGHQPWGYAQVPVAPGLEAKVAHTADLDVAALAAVDDDTVTVSTDTGRTFILRHAFHTEAPSLTDGADGAMVTLQMSALSIEEL